MWSWNHGHKSKVFPERHDKHDPLGANTHVVDQQNLHRSGAHFFPKDHVFNFEPNSLQDLNTQIGAYIGNTSNLITDFPGKNIDWSKYKWQMLQDLGAVLLGSGNVPDVDDLYYNAPGGDIDWSHY